MSRFGLRSKSDGMKITDDKQCVGSRKFLDSVKVATKKINASKKKTTTKPFADSIATLNCGASTNSVDPQNMPISIICSLPLSRLSGIIEKINANANSQRRHHECDDTPVGSFKEPETGEQTQTATQIVKVLCLYCDKKFSSLKLQLKHVEKFHIQQTDRRSSGRNSQSNEASTPTKESNASPTTNAAPQNAFPGCTFCKKTKAQQIAGPVNNLESLFLHLTDHHADKYHGCRLCMVRFQSVGKLAKHMQTTHNTTISASGEDSAGVARSESAGEPDDIYARVVGGSESGKTVKTRLQKLQKSTIGQPHNNNNNNTSSCNSSSSSSSNSSCNSSSSSLMNASSTSSPQTLLNEESLTIMGAEETILSRLGLTQNRLPNKRKGVRQRRESSSAALLPSPLLKSEQASTFAATMKIRNKTTKCVAAAATTDTDVVFRVPTRTDVQSCAFDEDFYKDVVSNVRTNLMYYLDGKLVCDGGADGAPANSLPPYPALPQIHSSLVKTAPQGSDNADDSELHAATNLTTSTAFPTLLTAEQYGGDVMKIRRPHTKHSWKWKWDSVKKFKIINEGGKMIKKMKQPMSGLRDLSKLDMWTQLTMRQKHEQHVLQSDPIDVPSVVDAGVSMRREGKQRLTDQLNFILDMRLLPNITLEQNEQTFIKLENEYCDGRLHGGSDATERSALMPAVDCDFLSMLHLEPHSGGAAQRSRLVLSGEWARPRCYLCMCCGAKFEKLKSLEEHKIFRHSNILSTHYELVGRELLSSNLMQHLFLPKRALHRYTSHHDELERSPRSKYVARKSHFNVASSTSTTVEDESSDSTQSLPNNGTLLRTYALKNSGGRNSHHDEFDADIKTNSTLDTTTSPTHSLQSSSSSLMTPVKQSPPGRDQTVHQQYAGATSCTKCQRKCNGTMDLYRHLLDCSGDYIWSMAKKRKYRYYCGSKRRRPCNKHHFADYRRNKRMPDMKASNVSETNDAEESALHNSHAKPKTSPRQRPSDAESIKKMLENLPPKRVCKKIFPTLTKAKKARKSKLMAKHQLYKTQVLRKTRSRQMSQAAALLLSKKKPNSSGRSGSSKVLPNAKSNATRKIVPSTPKAKSECIKTKSPSDANSDATHNKAESNMCHNETPTKQAKSAVRKQIASPARKCNDIDVKAIATAVPSVGTSAEQEKLPAAQVEVSTKIECAVKSLAANTTKTPAVAVTTANTEAPVTAHAVQKPFAAAAVDSMASNSAKKRSKKINDCIAMLTGKLEEKLKTEKTVVASKDCETEIDRAVPTEPPQPQTTPPEKKTPKRKAISRRIIKTIAVPTSPTPQQAQPISAIESTGATTTINMTPVALPQPLPLPLKESVPTKPTTVHIAKLPPNDVVNHVAPISNNLLAVPNLILNANVNLTTVTNLKSPTKPFFVPGDDKTRLLNASPSVPNKPQPPVISATPDAKPTLTTMTQVRPVLPPPQPPVIPVNATPKMQGFRPANKTGGCMLPVLPLHGPLEVSQTKLAPPQATQPVMPLIHAAPLPVPVAAPPSIPPPQQPPPTQPIIPPSAVLLQTATTTTAAVASVPVASVAPQPFHVEPLNLSNTKNLYKPTDGHTMPRPGIPARRKTICGFELPNSTEFNDMEPLDLSYKSKKPLANAGLYNNNNSSTTVPQLPLQSGNGDGAAGLGIGAKPIAITLPCDVSNKQFYSNLDLLKIPQVRNPSLVGPAATDSTQLNAKCSPVKKRNAKELPTAVPPSVALQTTPVKTAAKEVVAFGKKENNAKNKPVLKMDEEVINHIDDAINSVVNAVKASLEESEKLPDTTGGNLINAIIAMPKVPPVAAATVTTDTQRIETIMMPQKRLVRSKTLDCRPACMALNPPIAPSVVEQIKRTSPITASNMAQPAPVMPLPNVVTAKENNNIVTLSDQCPSDMMPMQEIREKPTMVPEQKKEEPKEAAVETLTFAAVENADESKSARHETPKLTEPVIADLDIPELLPAVELEECEPKPQEPPPNTVIENASNNEIPNELPSVSVDAIDCNVTADPKKKQRRRRKNELAAIVADQLLESFKIDKTRRDNLKKLENLAYEKSEDLLLTGMLLMSSTKRNAASGGLYSTDAGKDKVNTADATDPINRNVKDKLLNQTKVGGDEKRPPIESKDKVPDVRRSKRRPCRRKGTIIDNENISKLKSSLESFSIGIEKQLSEIEAKNSQLHNKESGGGGGNEGNGKQNGVEVPVKPPILRPSILDQPQANKLAENKISSRDPRLNKNIHKDAEAVSEILTRTRLKSMTENNFDELRDFEEDNYLTEIAKNVNEKIMSAANEEFMFANDGFEMVNDMQNDYSNSKYYRPPTSMSVRSAPNFDERSNYGSICDENTNTEVMDMDLDDELSVYTSYSQDIGRGRGRRRRRRRSILLKRKPKKRPNQDMPTETFECTLCKKTFFTANSLNKHNMTLAHVSRVSEQEYLQSKSMSAVDMMSYQRHTRIDKLDYGQKVKPPQIEVRAADEAALLVSQTALAEEKVPHKDSVEPVEKADAQRLNLNPDERLFFECCTILKGASDTNTHVNNSDTGGTLSYPPKEKHSEHNATTKMAPLKRSISETATMCTELVAHKELAFKAVPAKIVQPTVFRDSQSAKQAPNNKITTPTTPAASTNNTNLFASNYSAISQFSGVTNTTTSRFKTKAAMKGYENMHVDLSTIQQEYETKSTTVCKLTELAEIALEQDKPLPGVSPVYQPTIPAPVSEKYGSKQLTTTHGYVSLSMTDNQPKNTETHSSTSSKTIMHSSKLKAAVQEHNSTTPGKIIIPERPFKNIGLEEKESITFQKPKTTTLNLTLTDDNSVSTVSYSDRDDFDFGLLSCDEENSIKTSNNEKTINKNTSDSSSSSRATAKTFENKSLIMGRIFKNASSKGKPPVKVKSVGIQKDATPKADINQLFDELRGDGAIAAAAIQVETPVHPPILVPVIAPTAPTPLALPEPVASGSAARVHEAVGLGQRNERIVPPPLGECVFSGKLKTPTLTAATICANNVHAQVTKSSLPVTTTMTEVMESAAQVDRPSAKEKVKKTPGRKKKNSGKDITKLQSELGMSPAEIEKLIDEGQRKSKRRCATNRPKKLVEMWSSDEYEEFLSTKDIIALIEEKEKREQRKKRKNSVSQTNYANADSKDKDGIQQATEVQYTTANKKRNARAVSVAKKRQEVPEHYERVEEQKKRKSRTADEEAAAPYGHTNNADCAVKKTKKTKSISKNELTATKTTTNTTTGTTARPRRVTETKTKVNHLGGPEAGIDHEPAVPALATGTKALTKHKESPEATGDGPVEYDFATELEPSVPRPRRNKLNTNKRDELNNSLNGQITKETSPRAGSQLTLAVGQTAKKPSKGKRKNPTNQSSPRKKRLASEKLYYWSSSSDEDFGRINNQSADEFESREPHQQHGWIVGDSHKKIVTLLAIAKGNKRGRKSGKKKNKFK